MNSRERVQRAIHFERPDRVPISHGVLPAALEKYGAELEAILTEFSDDFGWDYTVKPTPEEYPSIYQVGYSEDAFGTQWRCLESGLKGIPIGFPLADWAAYDSYQWPELPVGTPAYCIHSAHVEGRDGRWYPRGGVIKFWEQMEQIRGMEALMLDIAEGSAEFERFLDDMLAFNLRWIDRWLACDFDGLVFADDWGSQRNLLISPKTWRRVFKPAYAAMFGKVKAAGWNVHLHSDGMILDIIPDLIEIGVDVLNCQTMVIGPEKLRPFAGQVCFRTDLDRQHILPHGSPAQVQEHVHEVFDAVGTSDGGIIAFGEVSPDVPLDNVRAMYQAFVDYTPAGTASTE